MFNVCLFDDRVASSSSFACVALSARAEAALIGWIPINSRLCTVRLESLSKVQRNRYERQCIFVIAYAPTDCSPDEFYNHLNVLLQKMRPKDIAVLTRDLNVQVSCLGTKESL